MTFILDMSNGKEYAGEAFSCPNQGTEKSEQPLTNGDDHCPTLQLVTIASTTSHKHPTSSIPGCAIDSLLISIED